MEEEILMSGAIEEAVESEWRKGFLGSRECWDEKRWKLMLEMVDGKQEKCQMHRQELRDMKDRYKREANYPQVRHVFKKGVMQMLKESEGSVWESGRDWFNQKIEEVIENQMEVVTKLYLEQWGKLEILYK